MVIDHKVGMIIQNQLEPNSTFSFDYSQFYNTKCIYRGPQVDGYLPSLAYVFNPSPFPILFDGSMTPELIDEMELMAKFFLSHEESVKLQKVDFKAQSIKTSKSRSGHRDCDGLTFDLGELIRNEVLEIMKGNGFFSVRIDLFFHYKKKYIVGASFNVSSEAYKSNSYPSNPEYIRKWAQKLQAEYIRLVTIEHVIG